MFALLLSLLFGFAPMIFLAWLVYWIDRWEKEPLRLLGGVFLWGALVAAGGAFVINSVMGLSINLFTHSHALTELATGSVVAPVVEELLKALAVLLVFLIKHDEFDTILDGVVYAAVAALGFAATENTLYIYRDGFLAAGYAGMLSMVFVRVVLVGWQHPFYTAFTGIGLATARLSRRREVQLAAPVFGLLLAIIFHALHNLFAVSLTGFSGFVAGTIFDWTGWTFMFLFVLWAMYREHRWIVEYLREEVALGVISPAQYQAAASTLGVSIARFGAMMNGRYRPTSRFYQVCAELAFKKHQRQLMGEEKDNTPYVSS